MKTVEEMSPKEIRQTLIWERVWDHLSQTQPRLVLNNLRIVDHKAKMLVDATNGGADWMQVAPEILTEPEIEDERELSEKEQKQLQLMTAKVEEMLEELENQAHQKKFAQT